MPRVFFCLAVLVGWAQLAAPLPAQPPAAAERVSIYVGVERKIVDFLPPGERVVPTRERAELYVAEHIGTPPAWLAEWTTRQLAAGNYVLAGERAPLRLVFEWHDVDPQITHIGRPLQFIVPGGKKVLLPRETKRGRAWETEAPFCMVTAYDASASATEEARRSPLWQMTWWIVLVEVLPRGQVTVGPVQEKN